MTTRKCAYTKEQIAKYDKPAEPLTSNQLSEQARALAILFHDTYERLAPKYGYETRQDTKRFDPETPNGRLMVAVCLDLLALDHLWSRRQDEIERMRRILKAIALATDKGALYESLAVYNTAEGALRGIVEPVDSAVETFAQRTVPCPTCGSPLKCHPLPPAGDSQRPAEKASAYVVPAPTWTAADGDLG